MSMQSPNSPRIGIGFFSRVLRSVYQSDIYTRQVVVQSFVPESLQHSTPTPASKLWCEPCLHAEGHGVQETVRLVVAADVEGHL